MQKIKTVQPYKLYKKVFKDKSKAKWSIIGVLAFLIIYPLIMGDPALFLMPLVMALLSLPLMVYNPFMKKEYEPGKSYSWVKDYASGKPTFIIKWLPIIGLIGGLIADIAALMFPVCTLIAGGGCALLAFLVKKNPEKWMDKESRLRMESHQDVDYNVKVDLNELYGVNDKLQICYQNFDYEKTGMEDGDYLLGVSAQAVYFICKNKEIIKTKIDFEEIDTLGLLATIGNVYVFNMISQKGVEINIIVNQNNSLVVSPTMLFNSLLNLLDGFIQNGGIATSSTSRRKRMTINSSDSSAFAPEAPSLKDTGRNIDLGKTASLGEDSTASTSDNRVVDISYNDGLLAEMAAATFVESNRKIEL